MMPNCERCAKWEAETKKLLEEVRRDAERATWSEQWEMRRVAGKINALLARMKESG